jgi:hypothetical protein
VEGGREREMGMAMDVGSAEWNSEDEEDEEDEEERSRCMGI